MENDNSMNRLLERAFAAASSLPDEDQEAFGAQILAEIEDERGWNERFTTSPEKRAKLARQARQRVAKGEALPYDPSDTSPLDAPPMTDAP